MAVIDVVFIVIIFVAALRCAIRGFIGELLSMAALILGLLAAIFLFRQGAVFVRNWFMPEMKLLPEIIAFIAILILVYIIVKIVEAALKSIIEGIHLGGLDRFLGLIFGVVEGAIIVCLLLFLISIQPFFDPYRALGSSLFAKILVPFIFGNKTQILESLEGLSDV